MKQTLTKLFFNTLENKLWATLENLNSVQFAVSSATQKLHWEWTNQNETLVCDLEELTFELNKTELNTSASLKELFQKCWGITLFTYNPLKPNKLIKLYKLSAHSTKSLYTHGHIMSLTGMKNCIIDELINHWYDLKPVHLRNDTPSISGMETFLSLRLDDKVEELFIVEHLILQRAGKKWMLGEKMEDGVEWLTGGKELIELLGDKLLFWFLQEFVYEELGVIVDRFLHWETGRLSETYDRDYFSMTWKNC